MTNRKLRPQTPDSALVRIAFLWMLGSAVMLIGCVENNRDDAMDLDASVDSADADPKTDASEDDQSTLLDAGEPELEDWEMYLAVDNQFDVYFGTPNGTTGSLVGKGTDWTKEYFYTAVGKNPTDYLYVATTSDRGGAQGFMGVFKNTTRNKTTTTGDGVWQVFAAGAYETTNPYWPDPWPESVLPTQAQVDTAIAYAQENDLWLTPVSYPEFDNDPDTDPTADTPWTWNPWYYDYENIPLDALWIWHDSETIADGSIPGPFTGGNHDEFLVFRVVGKAEIIIQ